MKIEQQVKHFVEKRSNFSSFPQYFRYSSVFKSPNTYKFVKCGCSNYFFLNSKNLICRGTDISKCFRESLEFEITRVVCIYLGTTEPIVVTLNLITLKPMLEEETYAASQTTLLYRKILNKSESLIFGFFLCSLFTKKANF